MMFYKRIVLAEHERALYLEDRKLMKILSPGVHKIFDPFGRIEVQVHDVSNPEFDHPHAELLVKSASDLCADVFDIVETSEQEVGVIYYDSVFAEVLPPSTRKVYWKGLVRITVGIVNIAEQFELPRELASVLVRPRGNSVASRLAAFVYSAEVADKQSGLLIVDGEFVRTLTPGFHAFWKFNRSINVEQFDTRVQAMEVSGQEILTRDKVSLRVNLSAQYSVTDALQARRDLKDPLDWLYRELQFALRQAVGTCNLDALLGNKNELDNSIFDSVAKRAAEHGLSLCSVGVKDIILPGDMKDIMNQVVAAEKVAQANVIKRREETAATRSALNTAKLMEDNPTLMRLKELEVLEKVTEKVDRLTVFGGLEGILKDTIKINV